MRRIIGYILCAMHNEREWGFGASTTGEQPFESITTNGLVPFSRRVELAPAVRVLRELHGIDAVRIGKIKLTIAESLSDLEVLKPRKWFIVIQKTQPLQLFGPRTPRSHNHFDGRSDLFDNGWVAFEDFARADYVASEVHRQVQVAATVAQFQLRWLP